jgi:hypothetical protein
MQANAYRSALRLMISSFQAKRELMSFPKERHTVDSFRSYMVRAMQRITVQTMTARSRLVME